MTVADFQGRSVLVAGAHLAALAQDALAGARLEIASLRDRAQALADVHGAVELVLIDADEADPADLAAALAALTARSRPPAVLMAGAHLPAALVKALMKIDRSDVLEPPFTASELTRTAAALLAAAPQSSEPSKTHCWSVMGAVGGCGATTIAVELACFLTRRSGADRRVALVDLNLVDGAASAYLGATPAMLLAEASSAPDRIDPALLNAFSMRVGEGLDLLAGPRDPVAYSRVSQTAVCRMLEVACQVYDWVVVDLPRHRQAWTLDVLAGSDEILVISELTVPALLSARSLAAEIEAELPDGAHPRIILNRLANRVFGPAPSLAEAEKALQRKADGGVTSDWEAAAASVNLGGSIAQHRPRSKIVRDIGLLVDRLTEAAPVSRARTA
jgi:pilus assembly protein CpaE